MTPECISSLNLSSYAFVRDTVHVFHILQINNRNLTNLLFPAREIHVRLKSDTFPTNSTIVQSMQRARKHSCFDASEIRARVRKYK